MLFSIIVVVTQFWKVMLPNQIEYTVNEYFGDISYHSKYTFALHDTVDWLDGVLVAVEDNQMIGVVYLEKKYGVYKVKNHALCSKIDTIKEPFMENIDFQYRLLRVQSFVQDKDILLAYVKDTDISSFKIENASLQLDLDLQENEKLVFGEVNQLFSIIKTESMIHEETLIEWKGEKLEEQLKYNFKNYKLKASKPLKIATVGGITINVDKSIIIDKLELEDLDDLSAENYDALLIKSQISNSYFDKKTLDRLIEDNWDVFIIDPKENPRLFGNNRIDENTIVIKKGRKGIGNWSKCDYYDLESNYVRVYNSIFELISNKKE